MKNYDLDNFEPAAKIVVIGVGGGGNNAVNRMIDEEIENVDFYVANTDKQTLATSKAHNRLVLGADITGGLGAGGDPEMGKRAAEASADDIKEIVKGANMVFIAAGMGGGTGTGASPIIAKIARDAGALVIAIVTRPFGFEGKKRIAYSVEGLNNLKANVDAIIVVSNDKLLMMEGNSPIGNAFSEGDKVLAQSVKTVVNLILLPAIINLDFADVRNTLQNSGVALIGFGMGSGSERARDAAINAVNSPLLEASIQGAKKAIVSITCGPKVSLFETQETVNRLIEASGSAIDIKFGIAINDQLNDEILVSVIAAQFETDFDFSAPNMIVRAEDNKAESENVLATQEEINRQVKKEEEIDDKSIIPSFLKD